MIHKEKGNHLNLKTALLGKEEKLHQLTGFQDKKTGEQFLLGKFFWDMYFSGESIKTMCSELKIGYKLLRTAYPQLNFKKRGRIKPKYMGRNRWKLRLSFKTRPSWKEFLIKENFVLRHTSRKGQQVWGLRKIRQTSDPKSWVEKINLLYKLDMSVLKLQKSVRTTA